MRKSLLAGLIALAAAGPIACADTTSSQTTTTSTTTTVSPASRDYSSRKSEQRLDQNGNVIKKSQTYQSPDPLTGDSSLKSSTTIERPDGTTHTVEIERTTDGNSNDTTEVERRTTTRPNP